MIWIEEEKNNMNTIQNSLLGTVSCTVDSLSKSWGWFTSFGHDFWWFLAIFGPDFGRFLAIFGDFRRFSAIFGPNLPQFGNFRPRFLAIFGAENGQIARQNLYRTVLPSSAPAPVQLVRDSLIITILNISHTCPPGQVIFSAVRPWIWTKMELWTFWANSFQL